MRKLTIIMIAAWAAVGLAIIIVLTMGLSGFQVFGFGSWLNFTGPPGNAVEVYRESFPVSEIDSISFRASIGRVIVKHSSDDQITIIQTASENIPDNMRLTSSRSGGTLTVGHGSGNISIFNRGMGNLQNNMEIFIPQSYTGDVNLRTTTGSMTLEDTWTFGNLELNTSTGSLRASSGLRASSATCTVSTGSLYLHSLHADNFSLNGSTGSITVQNLTGSGSVKGSTGRVALSGVEITDSLEVINSTGSITVTLKGEHSLNYNLRTGAGSINTYFGLNSGSGSSTLSGTTGDAPHKQLTVRTSTGSIGILQEN